MQYNKPDGNAVQYSTVVVKNLRWNGFLCASKSGDFVNIYIGDGSRSTSILFYPTSLKQIEKDIKEPKEQSEPNPDKEPVIIQPDTDEMGMDGDNMDNEDVEMDDN